MKTYILQLEAHDDVVTVCDKMNFGKAERILLVWPEHGKVLNRRLDLALLQRRSTSLGAQLAIVTKDSDVRYYAPRLGIPVFKSMRQAQNSAWRLPRRFRKIQVRKRHMRAGEREASEYPGVVSPYKILQEQRPRTATRVNPITRIGFFTLGVIAVLAIVALLLPSAQVRLTPEVSQQEMVIPVQASQEVTQATLAGIVPTHVITVTIEGRDSLPTTGLIQVPYSFATGKVMFTNLTDKPVSIKAGTILLTHSAEPISFEVTEAGELKSSPGETLSLHVRCLIPGSKGNLPAGSLVAIEGTLGTQVSVTNPEPTTGGGERAVSAPSDTDRQRLKRNLLASLKPTALRELARKLSPGDILLSDSLQLSGIVRESYFPSLHQAANQLSLSLRLEYRAMYVSASDLQAMAKSVLDANLPSGYFPVEKSLEIENLEAPTFSDNALPSWRIVARRQLQAQLPEPQALQLVLGLEPYQAGRRLHAAFRLSKPPEIYLTPSWWPRMPFLPFRIQFVIRDS